MAVTQWEMLVFGRHGNTGKATPDRARQLTPKGEEQSDRLAQMLAGHGIEVIFCSDADRAIATANIVAQRLGIKVIPLAELYPDATDNDVGTEMDQKFWSVTPYAPLSYFLNIDSELMRQFADRAAAAILQKIAETGVKRAAIIAHAVINQAFGCMMMEKTPKALLEEELGEAEAFRLYPDGRVDFIRQPTAGTV